MRDKHGMIFGCRAHRQTGAAMVETAVLLLLFFMFIAAIIDFSWVVYRKIVLAHAVRHGAHAGALCDAPNCKYDWTIPQAGREEVALEAVKAKLEALYFGGVGRVIISPASLDYDDDHILDGKFELIRVLAVAQPSCLFLCHFWPALNQPISANSTRKYEAGTCS